PTRLQASHDAERSNVAALQDVLLNQRIEYRHHRDRYVERRRHVDVDPRELLRCDANDRHRLSSEAYLAADDTWIGAELLGPRVVREHHDRGAARDAIFVWHEGAPKCGPDVKDVEEVGAHREAELALCDVLATPDEAGDEAAGCQQPLEAAS